MMRPKEGAVKLARASEILLEATKLLSASRSPKHHLIDHVQEPNIPKTDLDWFISQFSPPDKCLTQNLPCDHTAKYRQLFPLYIQLPFSQITTTILRLHSGWCNNLQRPEFGMAFQPFMYLLPPEYDDGIEKPRSTTSRDTPLPNPRVISNIVHRDFPATHPKYSHMIMQFGQFIGHDITHAPVEQGPAGETLNCSRSVV
ncbi:hypothetical protein OSTOST_06422 [Ostertagia ostertagi]